MQDNDDDLVVLVDAARAGDGTAMDALLRTVQPTVMQICCRILPHVHDAEEAAQDALLALTSGLATYDPRRGAFGPWMRSVAANSARTTYRSLKRRGTPASSEIEMVDPVRTSVVAGSRVDLLEALERLEAEHPATVEAFVLRDLSGLTYGEIAETLGTPTGSVKAQVSRARTFLRGLLG